MIKILINDKYKFISNENKKIINKMLEYISRIENINDDLLCELTIVDEKTSKKINKEYRNKDYETDIITFSFYDSNVSIKTSLLGEMFLCKEKVLTQANMYNHSFQRELMFLISHGIYHLLGYDHQTKIEEKEMLDKQYNVLEYLDVRR